VKKEAILPYSVKISVDVIQLVGSSKVLEIQIAKA
jgi:hypothetical protein